MASLPGHSEEARRHVPAGETPAREIARLDRLHARLLDGIADGLRPILTRAHERASRTRAAAGSTDTADRVATMAYAADAVVSLAAEGELDAADVEIVVETLANVGDEPDAALRLDLLRQVVRHPSLSELPSLVAGEIQLRALQCLGFVLGASVWRREPMGSIESVLVVGDDQTSRRVRATAKSALRRVPSLSLVGRASLRTMRVRRFGEPEGVVVARIAAHCDAALTDESLRIVASALTGTLERETLLERGARRERALVGAGEKRLMRLGFDLHDGPVQDVLALAQEIRVLRDELFPFVVESHRELAYRRFDDLVAQTSAIDGQLRELAHSLESKSIVSRPVGEVLHREVESFADRTGIGAELEIKGDPESLTAAQRIAVFRAIQEALANVREHSGATAVEIHVRSRRNATSVRITDNGEGFDVPQALTRAAQRGRLGVVGIGERVRMLGGTFSLDSEPGGPTTLLLTLPHWQTVEGGEGPTP